MMKDDMLNPNAVPGPTGRGFTLLEILLVITVITIVAGTGFLVISTLIASDARDTAARLIMQGMRRARASARQMREDDAWGIRVASRSVTVFKGDDYGVRDDAYDESFTFPGAVTTGGIAEIVFAKGTGLPSAEATVSVTFENETRSVVVNGVGAVSYER